MSHNFRSVVVAALVTVTLAACGVFRVWTRTQCVQLGYSIASAQEETKRLEADRARLQAEVAALKSPIRISTVAQNKLGLQPPVPEQVVVLKPRKDLGGQKLARRK